MRNIAKKARPFLALSLLSLSGCIVSDLSNSFDPKTPAGLLLNLNQASTSETRSTPSESDNPPLSTVCVFDRSQFDSCTLGQ